MMTITSLQWLQWGKGECFKKNNIFVFWFGVIIFEWLSMCPVQFELLLFETTCKYQSAKNIQGYSVSERANDWISLQFLCLWYKYVLLMFIARFIFCLICLWCNIQLHLVEFWEEKMIVVNLSRHVWDHWNCFVCLVFVNSVFINSAQCWCTCTCINDVFILFPF